MFDTQYAHPEFVAALDRLDPPLDNKQDTTNNSGR